MKLKIAKKTIIFIGLVALSVIFFISLNFFNSSRGFQFELAENVNRPHNHAMLGTNLSGLEDWSSELSLLDAFKTSRKWITQCADGEPECSGAWDTNEYNKLNLDANGWVKSLPAPAEPPEYTRVGTVLFVGLNGHYSGGKYVVLYDGEGTIEYHFDAKKSQESTLGRDVIDVTPSDQGMYLIITSTNPKKTGNYIRNIHVVPIKYEKTYRSEIFNPKFIKKIEKFDAIRFMDWMYTNSSEQRKWQDRPKVEKASYSYGGGMPIELMVALTNRIKAEPWFNMPHMATDEYMTNFAKLVKDTLNPNLGVHVEFSNEVWNGDYNFQQHQYATAQGEARWGKNAEYPYMQWYGMRTAQMCEIWKRVFGSQSKRVVCVMATQTGWRGLENYALDCPLWVAEGHAPCYQHGIDAFAITGYFHGNLIQKENQSLVESWTKEADGGVSKAFSQLESGGLLPVQENDDSLSGLASLFKYHAEVAKKRNLQLIAYEGGQHLVNPDSQVLTEFFIKLNRNPKMYDMYTKLLNEWKKAGGGLFMNFSDIVRPSKWGSWGALEYVDQSSSPKYDALIDFINKNR